MKDELKRVLSYNKLDFADSGILVEDIVELLKMLQNKRNNHKSRAKNCVEHMPNNKQTPKAIAEELGLLGVVKDDEVIAAAKQAIDENPKAVNDYLEGQKASLNFACWTGYEINKRKSRPWRDC